jgi:hypothetical protein
MRRALQIAFMRHGIAEQCNEAIAELVGKAAKFSRLASARVTRAVKAINRVGALASAQYEKTPAQVDKIESYLNAAVRAAVARLRGEAEADTNIEI